MSTTAIDSHLFVEDVVTALTSTSVDAGNAAAALRDQMQRAAQEFDQRTAEAFARALLGTLCQNPSDLRRLEALLILGLAHPSILEKHRISLATEGRRLALLLERAGQADRARCLLEVLAHRMPKEQTIDRDLAGIMRRTGSTDELIERYLRKADECAARGKAMEAVAWLQEVVLLDRNRRDVARMIRDLRYQEKERQELVRRRAKIAVIGLVLTGLAAWVVLREERIAQRYQALATQSGADSGSLQARLADVEALIGEERAWLGMHGALAERDRLRKEIDTIAASKEAVRHGLELELGQSEELAEVSRSRGMLLAEQGKFDEALVDLRRALALSTPHWTERGRVQADVAAIEAWQARPDHKSGLVNAKNQEPVRR